MHFSRISLALLVILNGGLQIRQPSSQPAPCKAGKFRFGDLILPYPATVGQLDSMYRMKFSGAGSFGKDTTLFQQSSGQAINLYLQHAGMRHKFDSTPKERPEDDYEQPVQEYRFSVPEQVCSFDSLRTMIERETGKTFRSFPAASYSSIYSPWRPFLKGRTVYVYTLRISDCMVVNLTNIHQAIPEGLPNAKVAPFTSADFILYKSDKEIEEMYEPFEVKNKDWLKRRDSLRKN